MTGNQKAALAWARRNEKRADVLAAQARESWRGAADIAQISESIDCLLNEAKRFRAYAYDVTQA